MASNYRQKLMTTAGGGAYLEVESSTWFRHLTQEVFMEARTQDVLCISLIRVKGQLLSDYTTAKTGSNQTHTDTHSHTSARSSKQLPTRG